MQPTQRSAVVVDELALVRLGLISLVTALGEPGAPPICVVGEAPGGREGAELVQVHGADLVVIGAPVDLPVVEAVHRVRSVSQTVAILALLGPAQVESVAAIVGAGADGVGLRGSPAADLTEALVAVAGGGRYVAPVLAPGLLGRLETARPAGDPRSDDLLTAREREVLALLAGGASNRDIAGSLSVTVATVKSHLVHLYAKLEVGNRQEALSRAVALGLLT